MPFSMIFLGTELKKNASASNVVIIISLNKCMMGEISKWGININIDKVLVFYALISCSSIQKNIDVEEKLKETVRYFLQLISKLIQVIA